MEATMMHPVMGQAPFYFYNPESKNEVRQQQQHFSQQQMAMYPMVPTLPSTPIYSRPTSACSQPPTLYSNAMSVMTPTASPQPISHKPAIMLETELYETSYFPSTPPLSTSGSTIGSPNSCDMLQTPMNPMFSGLDGFESLKDGFESAENSVLDWSSCGSPPMTPVYLESQFGQVSSLSACNSDLLSTTSCPSLSPSPVPYARSVSSPDRDVDFCDPRNLTVSAGNPTLAPEFSLTLGEEEIKAEQIKAITIASPQSFDFTTSLPSGLPTFEEFSDLESEDDFVNSLVNLTGEQCIDIGRPRACTGSSVVSLGHGSFIGDEDLSFDENDAFSFPSHSHSSPHSSCCEDSHQDKRVKMTSIKKEARTVAPVMDVAANNQSEETQQTTQSADAAEDSGASSGSEDATTPLPAPANRRGRKQSLTEDPSKTFVCDLCHRRFRRQEHLKRHYRSLHTQDKPFECNECGKKFSRSDNLAQHSRTHGSGAIVMNLLEDGETYDASMMSQPGTDYSTLGKVLFQIASEIPGSASESSSDEGSEQGKKKRKRSD